MFINNSGSNDTNIDSSFNKSNNKNKILIIIGVIALVIIVGIFLIPNLFKKEDNTFILQGGDINVYKNSKYIDLGFVAADSKGNDISSKVNVENNVNTKEIGEYTVTYTLGDSVLTRKVNVVNKTNISSIIVLKGLSNMEIELNKPYEEPGIMVIDSTSKNQDDKVVKYGNVDTSKTNTYKIVYAFVNSENVTVTTERYITVKWDLTIISFFVILFKVFILYLGKEKNE